MFYRLAGKEPVVGEETYVSETAIVIGDVRIGRNCYIGHGSILRGDYGTILIADRVVIEEGVIVHAPPEEKCEICTDAVIGHGAIIHARRIGFGVGIGMGAILSIRSEVDDGSVVAEGAVVPKGKKIQGGIVVAGNPAKKIRDITDKDRKFWEYSVKLYVNLARMYLAWGMEKMVSAKK